MMAANKLSGSSRRAADPPRVETLPIAALRPNPKNPRKHSSRQLKRLAALIREVGFINPVIVDENMMILAGYGRVSQQYQSSYSTI
jgi:hypothetical protein